MLNVGIELAILQLLFGALSIRLSYATALEQAHNNKLHLSNINNTL